ncbi:MAG TPA: hypothetical protein VGE74_12335 [Gemmata sp.]
MTPTGIEVIYQARVRADGTPYHLSICQDGLIIGFRPGKGRLVLWSEVVKLADGPPADRYGVVVCNKLLIITEDENEANDRAAEQRTVGNEAFVIRVPVSVSLPT